MKYFKMSELTFSQAARDRHIKNQPDDRQSANLIALVDTCLDPLREAYGKAVCVSSGFRCKKLNDIVGGVTNSQHLTGEAADVVPCVGGSLRDMALAAFDHADFDQLIVEQPMTNRWLHVSHSNGGTQRRQVLYYDGRTYQKVSRDFLEAL